MAEFQKVMNELNRMCNAYGDSCASCQIRIAKDGTCQSCSNWTRNHPEETERIVLQWIEHPIFTNGMKFRKVFGIDFEDKFPVSEYAWEWLNAEYKGGQDE